MSILIAFSSYTHRLHQVLEIEEPSRQHKLERFGFYQSYVYDNMFEEY